MAKTEKGHGNAVLFVQGWADWKLVRISVDWKCSWANNVKMQYYWNCRMKVAWNMYLKWKRCKYCKKWKMLKATNF